MDKQRQIREYLNTVDQAKLIEILDAVPFAYYHNGRKHIGAILSRMVNSGQIERVKRGVFKIKSNCSNKTTRLVKSNIVDSNQTSLF